MIGKSADFALTCPESLGSGRSAPVHRVVDDPNEYGFRCGVNPGSVPAERVTDDDDATTCKARDEETGGSRGTAMHLDTGSWDVPAACGDPRVRPWRRVTRDHAAVTCGRCRRTDAFRRVQPRLPIPEVPY